METSYTLGVANADFVTEQLAVGGDLDIQDVDLACQQALDILDAGVTHVLDVRQECDEPMWEEFPEIHYRWAGIDDAGQRVPASWFDDITSWAVAAIEQGGVVLAHCHMGINRGPSAGYAILLTLGWDPVEAIAAIRKARAVANVWYAEDALRWYYADDEVALKREIGRVRRWRKANPLDVVRIIAIKRAEGQ